MFENSQIYTEILHSIVGAAVSNVVNIFLCILYCIVIWIKYIVFKYMK